MTRNAYARFAGAKHLDVIDNPRYNLVKWATRALFEKVQWFISQMLYQLSGFICHTAGALMRIDYSFF